MNLPLAGQRIVEIGGGPSVAFCGRMLVALGADVVKVELDAGIRREPPFADRVPAPAVGGLLAWYCDAGKRSVALALGEADGRAAAEALIADAFVVLTDRLPDDLRELIPSAPWERTSIVSMRPLGASGPNAEHRGTELTMFAAGGEGFVLPGGLSYELYPDRQPIKAGGNLASFDLGVFGAVAAVGQVIARLRGVGGGSVVDLSSQEVELALNRDLLLTYANNGQLHSRATRRYGAAGSGILPCKDGYVMIQAVEDYHWQALLHLMGNPAWADDVELRTPEARRTRFREVNAKIEAWAARYTREELTRMGAEGGCPIGGFMDAQAIYEWEPLHEKGFFKDVQVTDSLAVQAPGIGMTLDGEALGPSGRVPAFGEHTRELLKASGVPPEEVDVAARAAFPHGDQP